MSAHSHRPKATEQTAKPTQEAPFFQAKLTVNTPGDAYEQEADAVADQVMRMQEGDAPIVQRMPLTSIGDVQRKCAACEQEEEQQAQRKETGGGDASGKAAPGIVSDVLSSGAGQAMDGGTRQFMESRFGQDFGQVRVHTDSRAAESASAIQARAYTSGKDIVFGAGQYQPESEGGKRLLAHELAHVGQQGGGVGRVQMTPQARSISFEDGDVISVPVEELPTGTSGNELIREQIRDFEGSTLSFFRNFDRGLNNFETAMSFSSSDEIEAQYLSAATSAIGKFFFEQAYGGIIGMVPGGPIVAGAFNAIKSIASSQIEEYQRSQVARGEARISEFIQGLRDQISTIEGSILEAIPNLRTSVMEKFDELPSAGEESAAVTGDRAVFIQRLTRAIESYGRNIRGIYDPPFFQEVISTRFSSTGEFSGPITQGGRRSGQLLMKLKVYLNEGNRFSISEADGQWSLLTNAPRSERLADSLERALSSQGRKPYQAAMEKTVMVRIEKEVSGLNDIIDGEISFSDSPADILVGRAYHSGRYYNDYFHSLWSYSEIRRRVLDTTGVQGASTIDWSIWD